ncbi:MAG: hypothetical protein HY914_12890 [Desulfomonile tiedjei]|nr:hypothetical protein [Desulfomonile tiedjei]
MRSESYWIVMPVLAFALMTAESNSQIFARDLLLSGESGMPVLFEQAPDAAIVAVAGGTDKPSGEKTDDGRGIRGDSSLGHDDGKGAAGTEAPDKVRVLKERIIDVQNNGKLGFRKIVPCSVVDGFGSYSPLEPGQPLSKLVFYCEPANVSTLLSGDRYVIDCTVDFLLMDLSGKVLLGKDSVLKINRVSRSPILDLYFKVEMNLKKPLNHSLLMKIVLHDKIKNQSVSATHRINVGAGTVKPPDKI